MTHSVPAQFLQTVIRQCRGARRKTVKIADSTGASLSGNDTLVRALALRRVLRRHYLAPDERYVGILMPPTVAGAVANLALAFDKRVSVNLNYVLTPDALQHCIDQAGIRHVITSRKVLERLDLSFNATVIILEDIAPLVTTADKAAAAALGMVAPVAVIEKALGLDSIREDDLLTVLFTSGSTGEPKGVMLSHGNIASNSRDTCDRMGILDEDMLTGVLPFFHAFGLTITLWMVLSTGAGAVFHTSPLEPDMIGEISRKHRATMLLATPTLLRLYLTRIPPEDFASMNLVATGAERLPVELADQFERKFGVRPFEGYGVTEASPVISFNVPQNRWHGDEPAPIRDGTVGQPIASVEVKVIDREDGRELGPDEEGVLFVRGPNVMVGYLHRPDLTARVIEDGWYNTGDIVRIDGDGFITIAGRMSQFSKIAGEMVPHLLIEETIARVLGEAPGEELHAAVTAVPHKRRGERVVVLHTPMTAKPEQITRGLKEAGLPLLFIPTDESFVEVDQLPMLGSGKIDLQQLRKMALAAFDDEGNRIPTLAANREE